MPVHLPAQVRLHHRALLLRTRCAKPLTTLLLVTSRAALSSDAVAAAAHAADAVRGAQFEADMVLAARIKAAERARARGERTTAAPRRPAIMPYARALVMPAATPGSGDGGAAAAAAGSATLAPFTPTMLAAQVQVAAGLGADGVILWGSSGDYHSTTAAAATATFSDGGGGGGGPEAGFDIGSAGTVNKSAAGVGPWLGCTSIETELVAFAGAAMDACAADRAACAVQRCSGHGRCVDYDATALENTCMLGAGAANASCRCDPGFAGAACNGSSWLSLLI